MPGLREEGWGSQVRPEYAGCPQHQYHQPSLVWASPEGASEPVQLLPSETGTVLLIHTRSFPEVLQGLGANTARREGHSCWSHCVLEPLSFQASQPRGDQVDPTTHAITSSQAAVPRGLSLDWEYSMPRAETSVYLSGGLMPIIKPGSHWILHIAGSCSVLSLGHKGTRGNSTSCDSHINNCGLCSMSCPA